MIIGAVLRITIFREGICFSCSDLTCNEIDFVGIVEWNEWEQGFVD